jgi:glycine/D-amino acid oxidase-like deaminating enzyme
MDRRTLLKLVAAASMAAVAPSNASPKGLKVVVAGAGIVGASIAYHLAKAGASVIVIDKEGPATHASRGTFAWINATYAKQPRHYHKLSQQSVANWHSLQQVLKLPLRWGGSLEWFSAVERQEKLTAQIAEQASWDEDARMLSAAEVTQREPHIDFGDAQQIAYSGNDGAVDPVLATRKLLAAATETGAVVRYPCELTDVSYVGGHLRSVHTSLGEIKADHLVLATGANSDLVKKIARVEIPQRTTPGIIAITVPMDRILNGIIAAPGAHMHQRDDGRIVLGEQSGAPANDAHRMRLEGRPNAFPNETISREHFGRMLAIAQQFAPAISTAKMESVYIGWRPLPLDGHPVLGAVQDRPGVYLAIMHSGVSLAPVVGQLATQEIISGNPVTQLAPYRPNRKFEYIKRY